jgi:hypothetical protein
MTTSGCETFASCDQCSFSVGNIHKFFRFFLWISVPILLSYFFKKEIAIDRMLILLNPNKKETLVHRVQLGITARP